MNSAFQKRAQPRCEKVIRRRVIFGDEILCPVCESDRVEEHSRYFSCVRCAQSWKSNGLSG